MTDITGLEAHTTQDSRGKPSLVVTVHAGDSVGAFATPSGASTGRHEIHEVGVAEGKRQFADYVIPALSGMDVTNQATIDATLSELAEQHNLGGDVLVGTSVACAKAAAAVQGLAIHTYLATLRDIIPSQRVPYLVVNLINGGAHAEAGGAIQEHWIIPRVGDPAQAYMQAQEVQQHLGNMLKNEARRGDEGGFVIPDVAAEKRFSLLSEAVGNADIMLGADIAASNFYADDMYTIDGHTYNPDAYEEYIGRLIKECGLTFVEDPFHEEDFTRFASLAGGSEALMVVGDDLTTTNRKRLEQAVQHGSIRAVIIKPNQVGTLSDTLDAMQYAREHGVHCIVSHRSGETMDTFIADLAYAFGCLGLKAGAPGQQERDVKYHRLIEISR